MSPLSKKTHYIRGSGILSNLAIYGKKIWDIWTKLVCLKKSNISGVVKLSLQTYMSITIALIACIPLAIARFVYEKLWRTSFISNPIIRISDCRRGSFRSSILVQVIYKSFMCRQWIRHFRPLCSSFQKPFRNVVDNEDTRRVWTRIRVSGEPIAGAAHYMIIVFYSKQALTISIINKAARVDIWIKSLSCVDTRQRVLGSSALFTYINCFMQ